MSTYKRANTAAQWFADRFPGSRLNPNVVVLHTTEGASWPSYSGGATAPNYTAMPDFTNKRLVWRAHFPDEMSARALRNQAGGVETNTLNAIQVELVGTCDPGTSKRWGSTRHILWPEAPDWALNDLADFLADVHERHGIKLDAPALWLPYPKSYGATAARLSFSEWRDFYGVCGHQHVPENSHGDPGNIDIVRILDRARALVVDATTPRAPEQAPQAAPEKAATGPVTRGPNIDHAIADAARARRATKGRGRRRTLKAALAALRSLPTWRKGRG